MKRLEDILPVQPAVSTEELYEESDLEVEEPLVEDQLVEDQEEITIPERILTDPEIIGYSDEQSQIDAYSLALTGNLPIVGDVKMCEIGAKRGDLAIFIKERLPLINLTYTGFEPNDLLVAASKVIFDRYQVSDNCNVYLSSFMSEDFSGEKFDVSVVVSNLITNAFITDGNKWEFIENFLKKLIPLTSERVILLLLHDAGGDENYIEFPVPNMVETLLRFNHPFKIDFGKISDMYTVVIDTTMKRFI